MMTNKIFLTFAASLFLITSALGQIISFDYQHDIQGVTELWHEIKLPNSVYSNCKDNLGDIRLFCVNEMQDTLEMPYILRQNFTLKKSSPKDFELLNQSENADGKFYTFQLKSVEKINTIDLNFKEKNFESFVKLEGSQDQKEWFTILKDYRLLAINNANTQYSFKKLSFPAADFAYYRLFIPHQNDPVFTSASLQQNVLIEGKEKESTLEKMEIKSSADKHQDTIFLTLKESIPLKDIKIEIKDSLDYFRRYALQYKIKNANKKGYLWRKGKTGYLNSREPNLLETNGFTAKDIRIIVYNHSNLPLNFGDIKVNQYVYSLAGRFSEKGDYFLAYGNKKSSAPTYDIAQFKNNIPAELKPVSLGNLKSFIKPPLIKKPSLFDNSWLLFVVMGLVIGLVGWFTLGMMKGMKEEK